MPKERGRRKVKKKKASKIIKKEEGRKTDQAKVRS